MWDQNLHDPFAPNQEQDRVRFPHGDGRLPETRSAEIVFAVLIGAWIVGVDRRHPGRDLGDRAVSDHQRADDAGLGWPVAVWLNAIARRRPRAAAGHALAAAPAVRATGLVWTLAAIVLGVVGSVRAVPAQQSEIYFALLTVVAAVTAAILPMSRSGAQGEPRATSDAQRGAATPSRPGLAVLVPWLWVGALGGPIESALAAPSPRSRSGGWRPRCSDRCGRTSPSQRGRAATAGRRARRRPRRGHGPDAVRGGDRRQRAEPRRDGVPAAARFRRRRARRSQAVVALFALAALGPLAFVEADETTIAWASTTSGSGR